MNHYKSREQHRNGPRSNWRNSSDQDFIIGVRESQEQAEDYLRNCYPGWKVGKSGGLFALVHPDGIRQVILIANSSTRQTVPPPPICDDTAFFRSQNQS